MPEIRKDPISDRWVIISTERGRRPAEFKAGGENSSSSETKSCPFCEGNESKTPKEVLAFRKPGTAPDTPGWTVRVMPNKFPALVIEGEVNRTGIGLLDMMSGIGAHEVIVETPRHNESITDLPDAHVEKILYAYRDRIRDLEKDKRFRYVLVFKNHGEAAGASLEHSHSQLIATPITPRYIKMELTNAREYFREKERCIFCDLIRQELSAGERIVAENEHFVVFTPFASRFPFEAWLLPRKHFSRFTDMGEEEMEYCARMLKDILARIKKTLYDAPYNYVVHTAPNIVNRPGRPDYWGTIQYDYHWHIEIIPRLTKTAGFEWGSGLYINPTPPEEAAKYLREIM